MVIFTIHLRGARAEAGCYDLELGPWKSYVVARQDWTPTLGYKDRVDMKGENARATASILTFFWPSRHGPQYAKRMKRQQGFKYRLNVPGERAATYLSRQMGCNRFVWNKALALCETRYPGYKKLSALLPQWKKEHPWLAEVDSIGLQQSLRQLDRAWQNFFGNPARFARPVFKKRFHDDFYRIVGAAAYKTGQSRVWVPKLGWLTFRQSRPWQGKVTSVTISRTAGHYHVSLLCELEVQQPALRDDPWVGIDVGIAQYATLSTGEHKASIAALQRNRRKLARLQRRFAKTQKGSVRRKKAAARIAKLHHYIAMKRRDHAHKTSSDLVKNHGRIRMEDLRLVHMMASAKGTLDNPGKNVAQKRGLNRHLADQGLRQFRTFVEYKLAWSGGVFEAVDPAYTSQTCHACKHVARENRPSQAVFECVSCGHLDHADINAAKNIRDTAGGEPRSERARRRRHKSACETHTTKAA